MFSKKISRLQKPSIPNISSSWLLYRSGLLRFLALSWEEVYSRKTLEDFYQQTHSTFIEEAFNVIVTSAWDLKNDRPKCTMHKFQKVKPQHHSASCSSQKEKFQPWSYGQKIRLRRESRSTAGRCEWTRGKMKLFPANAIKRVITF